MHFAFDEDRRAFAHTVAACIERNGAIDVVRAAWSASPGAADRKLWDELVEIGATGLTVPLQDGGVGLDVTWSALVLEAAGRAALPHPIVETVLVAAPFDSSVASGTMIATNLGGPHVPWAADADRLLLVDDSWTELHLVDRTAVELTQVNAVDAARRLGDPGWTPSSNSLITDDPVVIDLARDRGVFGTASVLVGLADQMLAMTTAYVIERQQFGVPIGSFQAVKHHLADALMAVSFARPAVHRASWSIANDEDTRSRDVSMAKVLASDAATEVAKTALQCHGAIGYTVEHDLHLFLKRAFALSRSWGSAPEHRRRIAAALGATSR